MSILNQSYKRDFTRCAGFPIYFPTEAYTFYLNFDQPINDVDFDNFRFDLILADGVTLHTADIGLLEKDDLGNGFYNIFCKWKFPEAPFGLYRFRIYDHVNDVVKCVSNIVQVETPNDAKATAIVSYRNEYNLNSIRFEENPDFWMRVRMPLIQVSISPVKEGKQYRNVSNRRLRNWRSYKDEVVKIESYYLVELTHAAMSVIYDHDTIFINETFIVPKGEYNIEHVQNSIASKATIEAIIDKDEKKPQSLLDIIVLGAEFDIAEFSEDDFN